MNLKKVETTSTGLIKARQQNRVSVSVLYFIFGNKHEIRNVAFSASKCSLGLFIMGGTGYLDSGRTHCTGLTSALASEREGEKKKI